MEDMARPDLQPGIYCSAGDDATGTNRHATGFNLACDSRGSQMRNVIILTAVLVLAATSVWGQSYPRDHDDDRAGWRDERDRDDLRGRSLRDDGRGHRMGGASFFVRSGDIRLGVRCDERESMRSCVDAALTLFDKVRSQQGTSSSSTGPSSPAPPR